MPVCSLPSLARASVLSVVLLSVALTGCKKNKPPAINFNQQLAPGQLALRKIPLEQYPDFSQATWNLNVLGPSIDNSLRYMAHGSSRQYFPYLDITHERAQASLRAFRELIANASTKGTGAGPYINEQIRANFEVYKSYGAPKPDGPGFTDTVLFTGYFTPIYEASLTRTGQFQWPLYRRPADLVSDPLTGSAIGRKNPDGSLSSGAYWTRAEIEGQNKLAGLELVYLKTRWEAYVITVQGSARLRLTDGRTLEVGYAGNNGYTYTSPGRQMVQDGVINAESLSFKTLTSYFASHPQDMDKYLWLNKRFVFFTETHGGPYGSLNVPVTSFASIATDKNELPNIYPRSMPAFLIAPVPRTDNPEVKWTFRGFMMDQDSGGAIRASGRCDIYMGIGDQAEGLAGHQLSEGELYYIAVKPELMSRYAAPTPAENLSGK
ncbi:MAG: MltA domain-containing protein [Bacillota bacterium]